MHIHNACVAAWSITVTLKITLTLNLFLSSKQSFVKSKKRERALMDFKLIDI